MNRVRMERRSFLKAAAQTLMAVPAASALGRLAEAQQAPAQTAAAHPCCSCGCGEGTREGQGFAERARRWIGATGDGKTKDTLAIQLTIERCSVFGGGEVVVPAGDYLTGALVLRSGVTLSMEEGATMNGSTGYE